MNNYNCPSGKRTSPYAVARRRDRKQPHEIQNNLCDDIQILEVSFPKPDIQKERSRKRNSSENKKENIPSEVYQKYSGCLLECQNENLDVSYLEEDTEKTQEWKSLDFKKNIQLKMMNCSEVYFTKSEENYIHESAKLYVMNLLPDQNYYHLPETGFDDIQFLNTTIEDEALKKNQFYFTNSFNPKKGKRRSYNNFDCYVTSHNDSEQHGNTHILPKGTQLLKPANKLVELVAQAINDSPNGLLQVHQIYSALQNKYPYFRFMDKMAINSWRSSIRHALYQKWFRKIHFKTESINRKGCYWAINWQYSPKTWTLPGVQKVTQLYFTRDSMEMLPTDLQSVVIVPEKDKQEGDDSVSYAVQCDSAEEFQNIINVTHDYAIEIRDEQNNKEISELVQDPDPVLVPWSAESLTSNSLTEPGTLLPKDSQVSHVPITLQMGAGIDTEMLDTSPDIWLQQCSVPSVWQQNVEDPTLCYSDTQPIMLTTLPYSTPLTNVWKIGN